jgi:hypothetical protein
MNDPTHRGLRGDLWAQARFADLVTLLGEPQSGRETDLLVMLSRLMSDAEPTCSSSWSAGSRPSRSFACEMMLIPASPEEGCSRGSPHVVYRSTIPR